MKGLNMLKLLSLFTMLMFGSMVNAAEATIPVMPSLEEIEAPSPQVSNRFLFLDGVITSDTIAPLKEALEQVIGSDDTSPVKILINSPGGEVLSGMAFINRMQNVKAKGIDIDCYVLDFAASMAFQIFTQCTHRYAMPASFLLWHGIRVRTREPITAALALSISEDLHRTDRLMITQLKSALNLSDDEIMHHFNNETFWPGMVLKEADPKFLDIVPAYPELMSTLETATKVAMPRMLFNLEKTEMIYLWRGYNKY